MHQKLRERRTAMAPWEDLWSAAESGNRGRIIDYLLCPGTHVDDGRYRRHCHVAVEATCPREGGRRVTRDQ